MSKGRVYSSLSELPNSSAITVNKEEQAFNPQWSFDYKPIGKFDEGLYPGMNQEYTRGANQKGWGLLPTAAGRLVGSAITKTLEGVASAFTGFQENALSKEINQAERHILDEWLPVYQTEGMDSDSLSQRLREPGWWASTATDGFAFMASAIIGAKGINAISKIPKVARLAKTLGASDDILMQIDKAQRSGIGKLLALDNPGIAFATGYNAFNEAGFEARGVYDELKNELAQSYGGEFEYLNPEQQAEISELAGKAAQQTFWYNVPMLLLSERIFNETILGNFFGLPEASAFKRIVKEGIEVNVKPLTKAQRAGLLGLPFAANIPTEAFQENYQLAVQNYFSNKAKTGEMLSMLDPENISGVLEQMGENFNTIEGKESMFLGAFLGAIGGAAGLGGLSKSEKKAQEYADILNKGITNLNQSGTRFFQTNADGTIMKKNGIPVPKTEEQLNKDWEQVADNFAKYQMSTTLQVLNELGDANAKDLVDIDRANSFSDLAYQFFGMEGGKEMFDQIIDDYATKIKQEYGESFDGKTVSDISTELKEEAEQLQSLYNLANSYYKIGAHPESLPIQYHSLWKQELYKKKFKEYSNNINEITSGIAGEIRTYIDDVIENPTKSKIAGLDKQIAGIDFKNVDSATTTLDLQNKIAKALSYNSLYKAERKHFEKELASEDFYVKLKEEIENESNQKVSEEEKAAQVEERKAKVEAEKAAKQATPSVQQATPQDIPVQPAMSQSAPQQPTQPPADIPQARDVQTDKRLVEDYLRGKKSVLATTIGRELGLGNAKELLEELVAEGVVEKTANGRYKFKEVSQQDTQTKSDAELAALEEQPQPIEFTEEVEEISDTPDTPIEIYTDKQINAQHENVLKSSEGKFLVTSALPEGHNVLAMRVVQMEKVFEGDAVTRQNKGNFELDEEGNTAYMHSAVKQGDTITIRPVTGARDVKQYVDIKNDKTVTFGEKIDNAPVESYYETVVENLPLEIVHGDTVIGHVHTVEWINPTNLTEQPEFMSLEEQRESLRAFREQFVNPDGSVKSLEIESTIEVKFEGKLAKAKTELELNQATPSFPIAIATNSNQVKTIDGKIIEVSHKVTPGSAGVVVDNMFFIAKRKRLDDSQKEILRAELENKKKDKEKIKSMVYTSEAADDSKALEAAKRQKSPNRYRLVISQFSYWIYDTQSKSLFTKNTNLDLYLSQELVANITPNTAEYNQQWVGNMLTTNIREVKANYDGNIEPTIFVHPVIKFSMPSALKQSQKIKGVKAETTDFSELDDFIDVNLSPAPVNVSQQALDLIKKCTGKGGMKAAKGLQTTFTPGSKWTMVKDLKGYPSHDKSGVDIQIGNGVTFKNNNGIKIKAEHGLILPRI